MVGARFMPVSDLPSQLNYSNKRSNLLTMAAPVEHWSNKRYGISRRDIFLLRTPTGWQVVGRIGGSSDREVTHYFDDESEARLMVQAMRDRVPGQLATWALMPHTPPRPPR